MKAEILFPEKNKTGILLHFVNLVSKLIWINDHLISFKTIAEQARFDYGMLQLNSPLYCLSYI